MSKCQWIGSGEGCSLDAVDGKSYCEHHYFEVYQKGTARARRKKDEKTAAQVWNIQDAFNEAVEQLEAEGYDFSEERWDVKELDLE
jgi:hypothetical protein